MPIKPKYSLDNKTKIIRSSTEFTDRESYINIFNDNLNKHAVKEHCLLVYYGVGGIGKTALRKELCKILEQNHKDTIWVVVDFDHPLHRDEETALFLLRRGLARKYNIEFHSFDVAYSIYWKKTHPNKPFNKETFKLLEESETLMKLVGILSHLHIIGLIPKLTMFIHDSQHQLKKWWKTRGQKELSILPNLEPKEILERLPMYLAADLKEGLAEKKCVIFLDTYEALWENQYNTGSFFLRDEWVRELVAHLPEPLWIVCGRDKLRWQETDSSWEQSLKQIPLDEFSTSDSELYLAKSGITEKEIQVVIIEASKGIPYYLDLAVDIYYEIKSKQQRNPVADDFARTQQEVLDRFIKYLDTTKIETLKILSCTRIWNRDIFKMLTERFHTGFPVTAINELHKYSFINDMHANDNFTMNGLMKNSLQERIDKETKKDIHRCLFEYYNSKLTEAADENILDKQSNPITEAFYHLKNLSDQNQLNEWFRKSTKKFRRAHNWKLLIPLYEELIFISNKESFINDDYIANLNDLGVAYWRTGSNNRAIDTINEALKYKKLYSGDNNLDYASYLNNLAVVYYSNSDSEKAVELHEQVLMIRKNILGENHTEVAYTLDNLALVYDNVGNYQRAAALQEQAKDIIKNNPDYDQLHFASSLHNLAVTYYHLKNYEKSEKLYRESIKIKTDNLDDKHPSLVFTYENLATLLYDIKKYEEALEFSKRTLEIKENIYAEGHDEIINSIELIIKILSELKRTEEAMKYKKRLTDINTK